MIIAKKIYENLEKFSITQKIFPTKVKSQNLMER